MDSYQTHKKNIYIEVMKISSSSFFFSSTKNKKKINKNQERAIQLFDKTRGDFEVSEGIRLVQTDDEEEPSQARSFNEIELSDDPDTREQEVDSLLVDRVARFIGSHTLQFKVSKESIKDVQRSLEEGKIDI